MDNSKEMIRIFQDKEIRTAWDEEGQRWLYSVVDVIGILTESENPRKYWSVMKVRLKKEGNELATICSQLKVRSSDGKHYNTDVLDAKDLSRLIKSIPSSKIESFRSWLTGTSTGHRDEVDASGFGCGVSDIALPLQNTFKNEIAGRTNSTANTAENMHRTVDPDITNKKDRDFEEMLSIIERAREKSFRAVNRELISMYWDIGRRVSEKVTEGIWGRSVVKELSQFIQSRFSGIKGFSPQNIWRMKQFYETYYRNTKLSALPREIGWTNNVLIMSMAKTDEAREFYLLLTKENNYSTRELERQISSMLFERTMISDDKNNLFLSKSPALTGLRDSYVLEFLDLPERHKEMDLRKAIVANLRDFILEFGKNFTFVGEEYRIQVGDTDFNIDLLFFNRELSCLIAVELKIDRFRPEHLGQLEFYLEALDRDVRKPGENPSVGLILCTEKNDTVVEYAMSRSMSPALVAAYQLHLPDKVLLENKLRELKEFAEKECEDGEL